MSEETVDNPPAAPAPVERPARARGGATALAIALLALLLAGYAAWRTRVHDETQPGAADAQKLAAQVEVLTHSVEQLRGNADALRARLDDNAKVDHSEREELLGLGERARLLEDAVANLADKRLSGRDTLALDEAELLLNLGAERYALFHDAPAAIAAYRQADSALGEVENAAFSTVRQSVAAELDALQATHSADPAQLLAQLAQARTQVLALPAAQRVAAPAETPNGSRLWRVLGALVVVRHDDDAQDVLRRDAGLARELTALDLRVAEAALLARDDARYHAALASARAQLAAFDHAAPEAAAVLGALDTLEHAQLAPAAPPILGTALKELRNLRAAHALRGNAPRSAPKTDEAPK